MAQSLSLGDPRTAVRCAECHVHAADVEARNHQGVAGYEHESDKCASCHRGL